MSIFIVDSIIVVSGFHPSFTPILPAPTHLPRSSPPYCRCPWTMHIRIKVLWFISSRLFNRSRCLPTCLYYVLCSLVFLSLYCLPLTASSSPFCSPGANINGAEPTRTACNTQLCASLPISSRGGKVFHHRTWEAGQTKLLPPSPSQSQGLNTHQPSTGRSVNLKISLLELCVKEGYKHFY